MKSGFLLLLLVATITGCATRYCERSEQVYETVAERAPLQSPEGLEVPPPDPNFEIPEATGEAVKYATPGTDAKGRPRSTCLDTPPSLLVSRPTAEPDEDAGPADEPALDESGQYDNEPAEETAEPAMDENGQDDSQPAEETAEPDPIQL